MTIGIYKITNKTTNKCYIGQSQNAENRMAEHKRYLRAGKYKKLKLQNAWNKYGEDDFIFEILEECTLDQLDEKEIFYIKKFNSHHKGYNNTDGGGGVRGWHHSQEFKDMISLNNKTRPYTEKQRQATIKYNKTRYFRHSEETKRKMSEAKKGKKFTEDQRINCSLGQYEYWEKHPERRKLQSDRFKENNPIYNLTEEQKKEISKKISEKNTGVKRSKETCEKIGNIHKNRKYMTNGKINKRVFEADFQKYLDLGFWFGRSIYWKNSNNVTESNNAAEIADRKSM